MRKAFSSASVMGREQALLPARGICVICIALCALECREPGQAQAELLLPWQEAVTHLWSSVLVRQSKELQALSWLINACACHSEWKYIWWLLCINGFFASSELC